MKEGMAEPKIKVLGPFLVIKVFILLIKRLHSHDLRLN